MSKKTTKQIKESGNEYLIAVKGNQPKLFKSIKALTDSQTPIGEYKSKERSRGRLENRHTKIYDAPDLGAKLGWEGIVQVMKVRGYGKRRKMNKKTKQAYGKAQPYDETRYYICSHKFTEPVKAHQMIRQHWSVENQLHWVKDVKYNEDRSKISNHNMATAKTILYNVAINIFGVNGFRSTLDARICFCNRIELLHKTCKHIMMEKQM